MADLNKFISQFKASPEMRGSGISSQIEQLLKESGKSKDWQKEQIRMAEAASIAGLPSFIPGKESPARMRLKDAIARSHAAGFKFPYFIGQKYEPTGDRGVTMDIENLVEALKAQEKAAIASGDRAVLDKISKERAFWEQEAKEGVSAAEWKKMTGERDPSRLFKADENIIPLR